MMNSTDNELLQKAEQFLREGNKQQAAPLLEEYLRGNINSARGWWALSFAVSEVEEQIECVERVLKLSPSHTAAQARLEKLRSAAPAPFKETSTNVRTPRKKKQNQTQTLQFSVLAVMGCIALGMVGIVGVMIVRGVWASPAQNPVNSGTPIGISLPPTWTPTATAISLPTETPQPTATIVSAPPTQDFLLTAVANAEVGPYYGHFAPDFTARNINTGQTEKLSDYKGSAVLLFFWATWCPYCEAEAPNLQNIYKIYKDDGFVILGINVGEDSSLASAYADSHFLTYSIMDDESRNIARLYQVNSFPSHFFIEPNGVITKVTIGAMDYWGLNAQVKGDLGLP